MSENTERRYLKWYNKVGYGSGDVAGNVVYNATRLLTLTNLEQVYKYSYFVPTSSIGVELLTRTAALTRNELNEMISVWLDEMAESHTTVTTGRYVEAYINEQK